MFLSVSARFLVNVEALNMVESVGNVARHRRAPIIVPGKKAGEYVLVYTPVISGESLANAYQRWLAEISNSEKLPVCSNCSQYFFVKHGDQAVFGDLEWELDLKKKMDKLDFHDIEREIIMNCVVEDIGGFMLPETKPVKRTSKFQTGFMIPAYDQIRSSALEAQFHVRYAPDPARHRIYYVELGSALYTFHFNLDVGAIGYTSMVKKESVVENDKRMDRIRVAIKALAHMLENRLFGARLSRFTPVDDLRSMLVTVSSPLPFTSSLGHSPQYIKNTIRRSRDFSEVIAREQINGWFVDKEGLDIELVSNERVSIEQVETISEAFNNVIEYVIGRMSG